jgi:hypothetical protein
MAQKLEQIIHNEKQEKYFGKRGISWHITCTCIKHLKEKFDFGEKTCMILSADAVAKEMVSDNQRFKRTERLEPKQIKRYFSKLASEKKKTTSKFKNMVILGFFSS